MDTPQQPEDAQAQYVSVRNKFRVTAAVAFAVLVLGAVFYHEVEHLSWLNAIYFCTITLTTVGYGDIVPHTDPGKIFTIFYVLTGIGIIATFANLFLQNAFHRQQLRQMFRIAKRQEKHESEQQDSRTNHTNS